MRPILAAMLLALCLGGAQAAPTYAEKFDQYVSLGWPPADVIAGLSRWFGLTFELATYDGETYVQQVSRRADRSIYRLEIVGKLPRGGAQ